MGPARPHSAAVPAARAIAHAREKNIDTNSPRTDSDFQQSGSSESSSNTVALGKSTKSESNSPPSKKTVRGPPRAPNPAHYLPAQYPPRLRPPRSRLPPLPDSSSQLVGQAQAPRAPSATLTSDASGATTPSPALHNSISITLPLWLEPSQPAFISPAPNLHWQLLSYHPARPNLSLHFDIAFPTHDIEYMQDSSYGIQRTPLSDADFDKPAADKKLTKMTINFQRNLFKWDIDVERDEGIRVQDVFEAIYAAFDIPLTPHERSLVTPFDRAGCEEAFRLRCNLAPALPIAQQRQGWKRVDALLHETIFCGLTQSKSGADWTLNLSGVVSKATDRRYLILDHIAADPTVRYQLDLETASSNSPPPLPVLELPDEYPPPHPSQIPNVLPEYSNFDLFNLPVIFCDPLAFR
ncbi:hypothetical protein F4604DRAFT_1073906 [Suillus subluteus]|nr:hypothetical protein F4604DRAFT_1073906 [Suillus subluteus]